MSQPAVYVLTVCRAHPEVEVCEIYEDRELAARRGADVACSNRDFATPLLEYEQWGRTETALLAEMEYFDTDLFIQIHGREITRSAFLDSGERPDEEASEGSPPASHG
jgi:hypothetical protein